MKKALLYLLFFAYTIIIVKPALLYASDLVAHIFWYSKHMATVHFENGKYHVHYEVMDAAKKGTQEKEANLPKSEIATEYITVSHLYHFYSLPPLVTRFQTAGSPVLHRYLNTDSPPPKA